MERYAKLTYTSNPNMKQYVGSFGYLSCDEYGRYAFRMEESGQTIQTSATKPNMTSGDVNHPVCRNIGFETLSGSAYQFDFMDIERLRDGVPRQLSGKDVSLESKIHEAQFLSRTLGGAGAREAERELG